MSVSKRFWWADGSDSFLVHKRLSSLMSTQCHGWAKVRWDEDMFADKEEAQYTLFREIGMADIFSPGKVIIVSGLPKCHAELAGEINKIPSGILLVLIAKPEKNLKLYARAVEMGEKARIDVPFVPTNISVVEWAANRARDMGFTIDETACRMLTEIVGLNINILTMEICKLGHMSQDGVIGPGAVQAAAYGDGEASFYDMADYLLAENRASAHAKMNILLSITEPQLIMGSFMEWSRRMAVAEGLDRKSSQTEYVMDVHKRGPSFEKEHSINIKEFEDKVVKKTPVKMFTDKGVYRACQDISGKPDWWGYYILASVAAAQVKLRRGCKAEAVMSDLIDTIIG